MSLILERFGMEDCKPVSTPMDPNTKWKSSSSDPPTNQPYKELIGCLQYLALSSRPDISAAVNILSKFQSTASDAHWSGLKRILRYLKGTSRTRIIYRKHLDSATLEGFADADYGNDPDDRKSISGYAFRLFGNLVSWSTKRQPTVSLSSTEAELISLCSATKEGLWLSNFLNELGVENLPIIIHEDNIPCIKFSEEPREHQRMKHIDIKFVFVRDLIKKGILKIKYIPSQEQPADVFTKPLPKSQCQRLFNLLDVKIEGKC